MPDVRGGPTTALNGQGLCEACNQAKEAPGWRVRTSTTFGCHTAEVTTPTSTTYVSKAPPLPGRITVTTEVDVVRFRVAVDRHAA